MTVDRKTPMPLHAQVASSIRTLISDGVYSKGALLPSEREMCEKYNVSRTTIRETLRELEREGLIRKIAGRGIFVNDRSPDLAVKVSLSGYTADVKREGGIPSSRLLEASMIMDPSSEILKSLHLSEGSTIFRVVRLRLNNNVPVALHTVYLNGSYCPDILDHNLSQDSLFKLLSTIYGVKLSRAQEYVYATLANSQELKLLTLTYPAAVLHSERTTYVENGDVMEYSLATYCGDSYKLVVNLDTQE